MLQEPLGFATRGDSPTTVVDWLPLHFSSMNRDTDFEEDFQSCYIIDLANYRARKGRKLGQRVRRRTPLSKPPHIVSRMKKALEWQQLLEDGVVPSRAELARREGITRARVTQIMKLLELAAEIQETILTLPAGTPERLVTERRLRALAGMTSMEQRAVFRAFIRGGHEGPKAAV